MLPLLLCVSVLFHVDVGFSQHERALIGTAASFLTQETLRQVSVEVVYDLDMRDARALTRLQNEMMLLRLDIIDPKIDVMDKANGARVLGWAAVPRAFIIPERIPDDAVFIHVVMHEMLHDLGAGHVPDPQAIMWPWGTGTLWLTAADWRSIDNALFSLTNTSGFARVDTCRKVLGL